MNPKILDIIIVVSVICGCALFIVSTSTLLPLYFLSKSQGVDTVTTQLLSSWVAFIILSVMVALPGIIGLIFRFIRKGAICKN